MPETPQDYLRFNVGSVSELIKQKLEPEFPDVRYRASSANILAEAVSSVFSLLLFQLNRTTANSAFGKSNSLTSLINSTKLIGYNPIGHQASSVFVDIFLEQTLSLLSYTIPRYSFVETTVGRFSTSADLTFINSTTPHDNAVLENVLLRGGSWVEHPMLYSDGTPNQRFVLSRGQDIVDHNSIDVYVRPSGGSWAQYNGVQSLFLSNGTDPAFESRYNDRGSYDITFGDGVNGCLLPDGAEVAIYYLATNTNITQLAAGDIDAGLARFATDRLNAILLDIVDTTKSIYLNTTKPFFDVISTTPTTPKSDPETVSEIRRNAPTAYQSQNRLVTSSDFRSFVFSNYTDFVSDVLVLSNEEYLDQYMAYYTDLGLDQPFLESRALYNQVKFAGSCNFNNVYLFMLPTSGEYLTDVQKQLIVNDLGESKMLGAEVVPADPIYVNFSVATPDNDISFDDIENSGIVVTKTPNTNRDDGDIISEVVEVIEGYFGEKVLGFNNTIDVTDLNSLVLSIDGVQAISTTNGSVTNSGLQFYQYNPSFSDSVFTTPPNNIFTGIFVPRLVNEDLVEKITIA